MAIRLLPFGVWRRLRMNGHELPANSNIDPDTLEITSGSGTDRIVHQLPIDDIRRAIAGFRRVGGVF